MQLSQIVTLKKKNPRAPEKQPWDTFSGSFLHFFGES